eukprot:CAMPEP_0197902686 /NCGR_PEP_ID=MMETSP1439-20131203/54104_1 /TAXON_ID=66791 /ORGANISM="Gonyaulax spinifera, Strain CCMP409" /LENGTH=64 /DNA_ID=CAMNT_0043523735 /DNA_START=78 /DNA_END=268 /DNA_ORIENTATION=+
MPVPPVGLGLHWRLAPSCHHLVPPQHFLQVSAVWPQACTGANSVATATIVAAARVAAHGCEAAA